MKYITDWTNRYIQIAKIYSEKIDSRIKKPIIRKGFKDVYHNYIIVIGQGKRNLFRNELAELGVETKIHYPIPLHLQKCSENLNYKIGSLPNCEMLCKSIISLPIYHTLTNKEINYIVESVNKTADKIL